MWGGGVFSENLRKAFEVFLTPEQLSDKKYISKLTDDIVDSYLTYGVIPSEYFLFGFWGQSHEYRSKFLCNKHKDQLMIQAVGYDKYNCELRDKYAFYLRYKEFFKRDVCKVITADDKEGFVEFCRKHPRFIAKPMEGMCGIGCQIVSVDGNAESLFDDLLGQGTWIIEELIKQHESMASWNSSSVNTVRLPSFMNSEGFHVLKPFFRSGRLGSVVDNAAQGGMFAVVDENTGILLTEGMNEAGCFCAKHPDSGLKFKGWQVPQWEDLLEVARQAHGMLPDHPYIGWDFAYTDKGWVFIEGDWGQFISEFNDHEGIREKFEKLIGAK